MFDVDNFAAVAKAMVNVTDVTIQDTRTGETMKRTFYRPGKRFPFEAVSKELAEYGYRILAIGETAVVDGQISWSNVFGKFIQEESI